MAQGDQPKSEIYFVPKRPEGQKGPWYRTGAIWPTKSSDIDRIDIELLNPATGEAIRLGFMVKPYASKTD